MDDVTLRAWWSRKQGLDGSVKGDSAAGVLRKTGWARSVGGAAPYLTLFSRGGIARDAADKAAENVDIHELPSARGCTYVVPNSDFALALKVGQEFSGSDMRTARKLGVTDSEIDRLCDAIVTALGKKELDPEQLREATGGSARNLGAEGKKKGLTTTMPVALARLQSAGAIRRIAANGRFDQQRYRYTLWRANPLDRMKLSAQEAYIELARRFFRWTGPATTAEFQWFSGLGAKVASTATAPLSLVPVGHGSPLLLLPEDRDALRAFKCPREPQFTLVSSLDGISHLRRNLKSLLSDDDAGRSVLGGKDRPLGGLSDLPSHAILDRGRLVGLWEYDVESESIVWMSFVGAPKQLKAAVEKTECFIREELGDARSFSLDSPKSRAPRIAALRAAGSGR